MSMLNKLNESMNFTYIIESISNIAFELTKDMRIAEHRYNENKLLKEDFAFECENFLYDIKMYPEVKLESKLMEHRNLILDKFEEKALIIEGVEVKYFQYKEDHNIILFKDAFTEELKLRYDNNFINEKNDLVLDEKTDIRQEIVSDILMKENTCAELVGLEVMLENIELKSEIPNSILEEQVLPYILRNYEDLRGFNEDCELTYNEVVVNGKIVPVISYVNIITEDVESIFTVSSELKYGNTYHYNLIEIMDK